jgi:PIN domain nuclease of toxin-antitoxin system
VAFLSLGLEKRKRGHVAEKPNRPSKVREDEGVAVASIAIWEIAWLAQHRRIVVTGSVESFVREPVARVILKPVTAEIAGLAVRLPDRFPKDPADRLIAATALAKGMRLITADARIRQAKVVDTVG